MRKISGIHSNYIGTPEKWTEFLVNWSDLRLRSYDLLVKQEKFRWEVEEGLIEQDLTEFQPQSVQAMQDNLARIEVYEAKYCALPNEVTEDGEWEAYSMELPELEIGRYVSFVYLAIRKFMSQVTPYMSESPTFKKHYFEQLGCDPAKNIALLIQKYRRDQYVLRPIYS